MTDPPGWAESRATGSRHGAGDEDPTGMDRQDPAVDDPERFPDPPVNVLADDCPCGGTIR
jgi:hypothetical protein